MPCTYVLNTHTHTHTHTPTHTDIIGLEDDEFNQVCVCVYVCIYKYMYLYKHAYIYVNTCISTHIRMREFLVDSGSGSPDWFLHGFLCILAFLQPTQKVGGRQVWRASYNRASSCGNIYNHLLPTHYTHPQTETRPFSTILWSMLKFIWKPNKKNKNHSQ